MNTFSDFFWDELAPQWLITIRKNLRAIRLKRYKHRKVREAKLFEEEVYHLAFNVLIRDNENSQTVGPFEIELPAHGLYFARKKLIEHLRNSIDVKIIDFKRYNNKQDLRCEHCEQFTIECDSEEGLLTDTCSYCGLSIFASPKDVLDQYYNEPEINENRVTPPKGVGGNSIGAKKGWETRRNNKLK